MNSNRTEDTRTIGLDRSAARSADTTASEADETLRTRDGALRTDVGTGTLGHDTVGVTPSGDLGEGSASGDLSGGVPPGIEDIGATAPAESVRTAAGQE